MKTVNISLPEKLKGAADQLVNEGFYASFSDLVRHSLRQTINGQTYDQWAAEAKTEFELGKSPILESDDEIERFVDAL